MNKFAGIVAGREEEGKYYIKVWLMKYSKMVLSVIQSDSPSVTNPEAKS
jgi:hypothetical protein